MKVTYNGKYVRIEDNADREDMMYLECVCGHLLGEHEYHNTPFSKVQFEISGCKACNCIQFKMTGKIETSSRSYHYA